MAPEFAAGFLGRMRPDAAAAVLAGLKPDKAYSISVMIAGRNATAPKADRDARRRFLTRPATLPDEAQAEGGPSMIGIIGIIMIFVMVFGGYVDGRRQDGDHPGGPAA